MKAEIVRSILGWTGLGLVALGAWGWHGWPAAALVIGLPVAAFYLYSEARDLIGSGGNDAGGH